MKKRKRESNTFTLIRDRYFKLDIDFENLLLNCKTEEEKKNLKTDYIISRANFRKALNLCFDENDPIVNDLIKKLEDLEKRIEKEIHNLNNISNVLKMISESVRIASTIIVMVMSIV